MRSIRHSHCLTAPAKAAGASAAQTDIYVLFNQFRLPSYELPRRLAKRANKKIYDAQSTGPSASPSLNCALKMRANM